MSYKLFELTSPSDLDGIAAYLDSWYEPDFVVDQLKNGLDARCRNILVESHYIDKDYRSTYYHYYAKKGHRYEPSCVRLHFFDSRVHLHQDGLQLIFAVDEPDGSASDAYFGFMVLRPTRYNTIGRTVLAPTAIRGFHGCLIQSEHKVHLLGHKLLVRGFPYMSQHMDISVCAHAACLHRVRLSAVRGAGASGPCRHCHRPHGFQPQDHAVCAASFLLRYDY